MVNNQPNESKSQTNTKKKQNQKTNPWMIVLIVCIALVFMLILALIAVNIAKPAPEPPLVQDDSWQKVLDAGVLRVATAADYPPFTYFNADHEIDGFDPALIRSIGGELGVQVEISDYAFEGLAAALKVGQADVVIAALSVTPEREALVDFSNIYYVGQDGLLARTDSGIESITSPNQMAGLRVGVQKLSVYEKWAQETLVDAGIISADQLFVYAKPEHAVDDLKLGRLDLVMMDLKPATAALALGDLKLVGQGLDQQRFAIAVPQGANTLKAEINRALLTLQNQGKVNQLISTYLGLNPEDVLPPPTPEPTPEACVDAMEFIKDLSYDDDDLTNIPEMDPDQSFQKGWRLKNTGSCTWNSSYFLKYVRGSSPAAQMQGQPTAIQGEVKPGQTYDIYVDLVAPLSADTYVGYWQMHNAANTAFGETIWVAVKVVTEEPEEPTATAAPSATPTMPPEPTATITAAPTATEVPPEPTATEVPPEPTATEAPPEPTATERPGADLLDTKWILVGYLADIEDEELTEPIPDVELNLLFDEDNTFNGNSGCNTYGGRYVTDGTQIIFNDVVASMIICEQPEGIMDQEALYLSLLEDVEEYRFNEDEQLELIRWVINADNQREDKILLVFDALRATPR